MSNVLVTGCNRGIGLALCRIYKERGDDVVLPGKLPGDLRLPVVRFLAREHEVVAGEGSSPGIDAVATGPNVFLLDIKLVTKWRITKIHDAVQGDCGDEI